MQDQDNVLEIELESLDFTNDSDECVIKKLMAQMSDVGFLFLKNLPEWDENSYLKACKAFHGIPDSLKKKIYHNSKP